MAERRKMDDMVMAPGQNHVEPSGVTFALCVGCLDIMHL